MGLRSVRIALGSEYASDYELIIVLISVHVNNYFWIDNSVIGERLKLERKRLGLNQEQFAALAGVTRNPYTNWETGNTSPTAVQLAALAAAGADVRYIITGERDGPAPEHLKADERLLLERYRASSPSLRDAALRVLLGGEVGSAKVRVGSNRGVVVEGGLVNTAPVNFDNRKGRKR